MQAEGVQATEVTYGCLLVACEHVSDVDRAFLLYKEACDQGIPPSDACHNILINVCTATGRFASVYSVLNLPCCSVVIAHKRRDHEHLFTPH